MFTMTNHDAEPAARAEPSEWGTRREGQGTGDTKEPMTWDTDSRWKRVAMRFGELLSKEGPLGYYKFSSDEWLHWARNTMARKHLMLTDEERSVIEVCAAHWQTAPASDVLRRLLERTK